MPWFRGQSCRDHALLCQETNHTCNNGRDADGCGNREQDALGVVLQAAEELVEVGLAIAVTRLARLSGLVLGSVVGLVDSEGLVLGLPGSEGLVVGLPGSVGLVVGSLGLAVGSLGLAEGSVEGLAGSSGSSGVGVSSCWRV